MSRAPEGVRVRAATAGDLETILRHRRSMFEAMGYGGAALAAMDEASRPFFAAKLAQREYAGFFAVDSEGHVLAGGGVVLLDFQPHPLDPFGRRGFVVNMWTEPPQRRRGLGRLLMQAMIDWARAEGLSTLYLHASAEGRPLYERLGFVSNNEMRLQLAPPR